MIDVTLLGTGATMPTPDRGVSAAILRCAGRSIEAHGLLPQSRLYVHLTDDYGTAIKVGQRHGRVVVYQVSSQAMHRDGYKFFYSVNGVWLTKAVPVQYLINLSQAQKHNE